MICAGGDKDDCSEKMKDFLDYIAGKETHGKLSDRLKDEVIKSRKHEQWRLSYMLLEEKYKEKYDEGLKRGCELEHQNTEVQRKRAEAAEDRAEAAEDRAEAAEAELAKYKAKYGDIK